MIVVYYGYYFVVYDYFELNQSFVVMVLCHQVEVFELLKSPDKEKNEFWKIAFSGQNALYRGLRQFRVRPRHTERVSPAQRTKSKEAFKRIFFFVWECEE